MADLLKKRELTEAGVTEAKVLRQTFVEIVSEQTYLLADLNTMEELEDGSLSGVLAGWAEGEIDSEKALVPLTIEGRDVAERLGAYDHLDQYDGDWVEATREAQHRRRKEIVDLLVETVHLQKSKKDKTVVDVQFRDIISIANGTPVAARVSEQAHTL